MFRIVCFVEDKNLPKLLHATAGLVLNMEPPAPVVNAVAKNGKVREVSREGSTAGRFLELAHKQFEKGTTVTSNQVRALIVEAGGQVASHSYFMRVLTDNKVVKLTKERGFYTVL